MCSEQQHAMCTSGICLRTVCCIDLSERSAVFPPLLLSCPAVLVSSQLPQIRSHSHTMPLSGLTGCLIRLDLHSLTDRRLINLFSNHNLQFGGCSSGHPCSSIAETLSGLTEATHLPSASLQSGRLQRPLQTAPGTQNIPSLSPLTSVSTQL